MLITNLFNKNIYDLQQLELSILISQDGFSYSIHAQNKCYALRAYRYQIKKASELVPAIQNTIEENDILLRLDFNQIRVCYVTEKFSLVPQMLYNQNDNQGYINFIGHGEQAVNTIFSQKNRRVNSHTVFALPNHIVDFIKETFPQASFYSQHNSLIDHFLKISPTPEEHTPVIFNINENIADILVIKEGQLSYCNSFKANADNDMVYFLASVYKFFKFELDHNKTILSGTIDRTSPVFEMLNKMVANLELVDLSNTLEFEVTIEDLKLSKHLNLLLLSQCE